MAINVKTVKKLVNIHTVTWQSMGLIGIGVVKCVRQDSNIV